MMHMDSFGSSHDSVSSMSFSYKLSFPRPFLTLVSMVQLLVISCSFGPGDSSFQSKPLPPAIVVLGDSTVDVGVNNNLITLIKCNFRPYGQDFVYGNLTRNPTGRFCNGKLIPDFFAEYLGLPYPLAYGDPEAKGANVLQGINVASSGSGWYDGTAALFNVISLPKQIEWVKEWQNELVDIMGQEAGATRAKEAVYIFSTGSNDWINNYYTIPDLQSRYSKPAFRTIILESVTKNIETLYRSGARRIVICSLPALGCVPSQITNHGNVVHRQCVDWILDDAKVFNEELGEVLTTMRSALPEAAIVLLDAYSLLFDAIQRPTNYGFIQKDRGCCGTGVYEVAILCNPLQPICEDVPHYLWWDSFHPTENFNKILAGVYWDIIKKEFHF